MAKIGSGLLSAAPNPLRDLRTLTQWLKCAIKRNQYKVLTDGKYTETSSKAHLTASRTSSLIFDPYELFGKKYP